MRAEFIGKTSMGFITGQIYTIETACKMVKARELCVLFNVHEKQLRNIVSDLRQNGEAICSSTYGYWYSRDPDDISTTLSRLVGQVDNMQKVIAGLNRILQEVQDEQKEN